MNDATLDYRRAYEAAKRELAQLIVAEEQGQRKMLALRKSMEAYSALCAVENTPLETNPITEWFKQNHSVPEDLKLLLQASYPLVESPKTLMEELKKLGHDLSRYDNPQSVIQTILARMVASGEAEESGGDKKAYRIAPPSVKAEITANKEFTDTVAEKIARARARISPKGATSVPMSKTEKAVETFLGKGSLTHLTKDSKK